jgi:oligoendopeptidase F
VASKVETLLDRPIESGADLRRYVYDWSELAARLWGEWARRYIAMNRNTADEELKQAHLEFNREVMPAWQVHDDKLNRRYLASEHRKELGEEFAVFDRNRARAAEIFREENTKLDAEDKRLAARSQELMGGVTVKFRGEELTREQCAVHLQDPDRATREEAWRALMDSTTAIEEELSDIFDELLGLRQKAAVNADFENFLGFGFAEKLRFDYTPEDCARFADAVEKVVVPAMRELNRVRRERLGVPSVRPWDGGASLFGAKAKELFKDEQGYVALAKKLFRAVDPSFADDFDILARNRMLDLMSRPHKAPGGYNCPVEDLGIPFIFFNAVGRRGDIRVMLHEGGHAFHSLASRENPIIDYRHPTHEVAEVASMSMELFGFEQLDKVLDESELREFTYEQFSGALGTLVSVAMIDSFQAWLYENPGHGRAERRAKWIELADRFSAGTDWSGLDDIRAIRWKWIPHLYNSPLYYIEYGIAQLGALQLWRKARHDRAAAIEGYRKLLRLGGSRPLPELFEAAGIRFAMDEAVLADLVPEVMTKIRGLLDGQGDDHRNTETQK